MNGLMDAIKDQDPFYPDPVDPTKFMRIYFHNQPGYKRLIELGEYPVFCFVGMTKAERGFKRFEGDNDYQHFAEKVSPDDYFDCHRELTDHYFRNMCYAAGCRPTTLGGSNEVVMAPLWIESYSEFLSFLKKLLIETNQSFYDHEKSFGYTPESHNSLIKEKNEEAVRAPKLHLVLEIIDKLKNLAKDAMIYVPQDAFGHFAITLTKKGYTNIYTDKDYDMNPSGMANVPDNITKITEEEYKNMDFDAVIGNPPYGKGGRLALKFLNDSADRVRAKNGQIILVLPKSVKKGSANYNKINRDLEIVSSKDCAKNDFAASIGACIQEWKIGENQRELDPEYGQHPHIEFLKYKNRHDADIFVGGDGEGVSGKVFLPGEKNADGKPWLDYKESTSHNYIRVRPDDDITKEEILQRIIAMGHNGDGSLRKIAKGTTNGIPHLGKGKFIKAYTERYGNGH
tara:strand:- start:990 stop:2354 length:1365 start_codon:yes stop_codon:yes gene_type:complete